MTVTFIYVKHCLVQFAFTTNLNSMQIFNFVDTRIMPLGNFSNHIETISSRASHAGRTILVNQLPLILTVLLNLA